MWDYLDIIIKMHTIEKFIFEIKSYNLNLNIGWIFFSTFGKRGLVKINWFDKIEGIKYKNIK